MAMLQINGYDCLSMIKDGNYEWMAMINGQCIVTRVPQPYPKKSKLKIDLVGK